jgi:LacI family transcriptional regulator
MPGLEQVNQRVLAERLGLAQSTVSRALAGDTRISQPTRERVFRAAQALGYTPNVIARSLVTQKTWNVGVILATTDYHFYALAAVAAQQTLMQQGFSTTLAVTSSSLDLEEQYVQFLAERQVEGLIVISYSGQANVAHLRRFRAHCPAVVVVNRYHDDPTLDTILLGDVHGGRIAAEHLIGLGHRNIAFIGLDTPSPASRAVAKGYFEALADAGLAIRPSYVVNVAKDVDAARGAAEQVLHCTPPPTAIVAVSDVHAAGALQAVLRSGRRVPDDVAIVGYDDTPGAIYTMPPLTSVRMPWDEAGRRAAELVLARIDNAGRPPVLEDLPCVLVVRGSSVGQADWASMKEDRPWPQP